MALSTREHAEQMLSELPPEGLQYLARFIEYLQFKYLGPPALESLPLATTLDRKPHPTIEQALGILATDQPPPSDTEVEHWLEEHRMEKYG